MQRSSRFSRKPRFVPQKCSFCETKIEPVYTDTAVLGKFMTERGKILGRSKTGVCSKHQRRLTSAIKRARQGALLPFIVRA